VSLLIRTSGTMALLFASTLAVAEWRTGESMADAHAGRNISHADFNALVEVLIDAMEKQEVPVAAQNRLLQRLAPMHRDIVTQ